MPDERERVVVAQVGAVLVSVRCRSTTAQRAVTDRACDQVLRTIQLHDTG